MYDTRLKWSRVSEDQQKKQNRQRKEEKSLFLEKFQFVNSVKNLLKTPEKKLEKSFIARGLKNGLQ